VPGELRQLINELRELMPLLRQAAGLARSTGLAGGAQGTGTGGRSQFGETPSAAAPATPAHSGGGTGYSNLAAALALRRYGVSFKDLSRTDAAVMNLNSFKYMRAMDDPGTRSDLRLARERSMLDMALGYPRSEAERRVDRTTAGQLYPAWHARQTKAREARYGRGLPGIGAEIAGIWGDKMLRAATAMQLASTVKDWATGKATLGTTIEGLGQTAFQYQMFRQIVKKGDTMSVMAKQMAKQGKGGAAIFAMRAAGAAESAGTMLVLEAGYEGVKNVWGKLAGRLTNDNELAGRIFGASGDAKETYTATTELNKSLRDLGVRRSRLAERTNSQGVQVSEWQSLETEEWNEEFMTRARTRGIMSAVKGGGFKAWARTVLDKAMNPNEFDERMLKKGLEQMIGEMRDRSKEGDEYFARGDINEAARKYKVARGVLADDSVAPYLWRNPERVFMALESGRVASRNWARSQVSRGADRSGD